MTHHKTRQHSQKYEFSQNSPTLTKTYLTTHFDSNENKTFHKTFQHLEKTQHFIKYEINESETFQKTLQHN